MSVRRLVLCLVATVTLAAGQAHGRPEPFDPFGAARIDARPGAQIPLDAVFQDETGRTLSLRQLAEGRTLIIAPVQHRCRNLCGLTLTGLRAAIAGQAYRPGRNFTVVALGIDPREDVAAAQSSAARLAPAAGGGVHAVVGSETEIARVTQALGFRYRWDPRLGQYAHITGAAVVAPGGRLTRWLYGVAPSSRDLHLALTDAGRGRIGDFGDRLQLLCYHYDPRTGRYDNLVLGLLRAVGVLAAAALALLVGVLLWRGRAERPPG